MLYDGDTFTHEGRTFLFRTEHDHDSGAPWDNEDGHGPVTDWTTRDKRPGELVLNGDRRGGRRFYDFQEACRIARRDGWGWLPGDLETFQREDGMHVARVKARYGLPAMFEAAAPDINEAIRATYAAHRATMSARAYAAGAALNDFQRLKDWCLDRWSYVGVTVELLDLEGEPTGRTASLWGIESDAGDYLEEAARQLTHEIDFPRVVFVPPMAEARA